MRAFIQRNAIPLFLGLVALTLAIAAYQHQGMYLVFDGLNSGLSVLWMTVPLLVAAFLTAGMIQALIKEEIVKHWLGSQSGWRGLLLACVAGALIPGGPYVYYPIAAALLKTGAGLGVLVAFISAKNLWSISRIPLEVALLGSEITLTRFWITLVVPPLLGFLAELLFGKSIERIRKDTL